jgi:hypothetical protein
MSPLPVLGTDVTVMSHAHASSSVDVYQCQGNWARDGVSDPYWAMLWDLVEDDNYGHSSGSLSEIPLALLDNSQNAGLPADGPSTSQKQWRAEAPVAQASETLPSAILSQLSDVRSSLRSYRCLCCDQQCMRQIRG